MQLSATLSSNCGLRTVFTYFPSRLQAHPHSWSCRSWISSLLLSPTTTRIIHSYVFPLRVMLIAIHRRWSVISASALLLATAAEAQVWNLTDTYSGNTFSNQWNYWGDTNTTGTDPTHGLVKFVGKSAAQASNLTYVDQQGIFHARVDTTPVQLEGRPSVRMTSKKTFEDGIIVMNVTHIPIGCSVWPAIWMVNPNTDTYPKGGEIDILENANVADTGSNLVSLHTANSCILSNQKQTGVTDLTQCQVDYATGNTGCRVEMNQTNSPTWGKSFNDAGGGVFVMERSLGSAGNGVRVWHWSQSQAPASVKSGSQSLDVSTFGTPASDMPIANMCHSDCGSLALVLDITLCGDWAGQTYNQSGCNLQFPACSFQVGYNGSSYNQS